SRRVWCAARPRWWPRSTRTGPRRWTPGWRRWEARSTAGRFPRSTRRPTTRTPRRSRPTSPRPRPSTPRRAPTARPSSRSGSIGSRPSSRSACRRRRSAASRPRRRPRRSSPPSRPRPPARTPRPREMRPDYSTQSNPKVRPNMATQAQTQSPGSSPSPSPTPITDEVRHRSGWSMFMGVLTVALGAVLIIYPFTTANVTSVFVGSMLILVGVADLVLALASQTPKTFFLEILLAALYGFAGIVLVSRPYEGAEALTLFVGIILVVRAVVALIAAFRLRPLDGWGWVLADAIASGVAGGLIIAKWPSSTSWAVGTLLGAAVIVTGCAQIYFASRVNQGAKNVQKA